MDGAVLWWCVGVGAHVFARLQVKISQQTRCANADRSPHRRPSGEKGGNDDNRAYQETEADQLLLIHRAHRSRAGKARHRIMRQRRPNERSHGEGRGLPGCRGSKFPPLSFEPQSSLQSVVFLPVALAAHVRFPLMLGRRLASVPRSRPRSERIDRAE
jgi:hypothetical protein